MKRIIEHSFVPPGLVDLSLTRDQAIRRTKVVGKVIIVHQHAAYKPLEGQPCQPGTEYAAGQHEAYVGGEQRLDVDAVLKEGEDQ